MKLRIRHDGVSVWTTLGIVRARVGTFGATGLLVSAVAFAVVACGRAPSPAPPTSTSVHTAVTSIMVFAATPLKPAFTLLAGKFQTDNPGATVDFDFATSAELANKLSRGVSADVFASADTAQMDTVVKADLASGDPVNFATDTLAIVTAPGDPKQVHSFADLAKPDVRVAVCQAAAPCGVAAQHIADSTGVHFTPVSEEPIGAAVLARVTGGEADVGLVYHDDAHKAGDKVDTIRFPESGEAVNVYPIVVVKKAAQSALAQKFFYLVTGPTGQRVLSQSGFDSP
jgi:molybdate transport system substrate-binding protein